MAEKEGKPFFLTKSDYIYNSLKDDIVTGVLKSNERLILSKVAEQFNASEVPVREAIKKLEVNGLVKNVPYVGAVVKALNDTEVKDLYQIRAYVESLAIKLAIQRSDKAGIKKLKEIIMVMEGAMKEGDVAEFGRTDKKFHLEIARQSGNTRLHRMIEELWNETEQAQSIFRADPALMKQSFEEHLDIFHTIVKNNIEQAEELAKKHRLRIAKKVLEHISSEEDI